MLEKLKIILEKHQITTIYNYSHYIKCNNI